MDNKELKVDTLFKEGVKEVVIREGRALRIVDERQKVVESGNIIAPGNYAEIMLPNPQTALVIFSRSKMEIKYFENPRTKFAAEITGKLLLNPELVNFGINSDKVYEPKKLSDFLNFNRHHFTKKEDGECLVKGLRSFSATVNTIIENSGDARGNIRSLLDRKVDSKLPEKFALKMPIFIGYPSQEFWVDICIDAKNTTIEIWLESPELNELIKTQRDGIMDEQLGRLPDLVKIEQ